MDIIKELELKMLEAFEENEDDKVYFYEEIIKRSNLTEFLQGYICRYMDEQSSIIDTTDKDFIYYIISFIKRLNIEEK